MRRLYSTFLRGWPAAGVLLLRLVLSCSLLLSALTGAGGPYQPQVFVRILEIVAAALLVIGFWTPLASVAVGLIQVSIVIAGIATLDLVLLRAGVGLSLAFLGPGVWSVDARLYGRRRVEIKSPNAS